MEEINYHGRPAHQNAHERFIAQVEKFRQEADNGMAIFVPIKLEKTAIDWLKNHILQMDKKVSSRDECQGYKIN